MATAWLPLWLPLDFRASPSFFLFFFMMNSEVAKVGRGFGHRIRAPIRDGKLWPPWLPRHKTSVINHLAVAMMATDGHPMATGLCHDFNGLLDFVASLFLDHLERYPHRALFGAGETDVGARGLGQLAVGAAQPGE